MITRRAAFGLIGGLLALGGAPAFADDPFPSRPVRLVIPFAAGGNTDIVGRLIANGMTGPLGQQMIVENRAGAGTVVGTEVVAKAPPDGYTVLLTTIAHAINPALYKKLTFDTVEDFRPVGLVAQIPTVLVVHPSLGVSDLKSFIALLKANPGKYNYGSAGVGSVQHLVGAWFKSRAGVDVTHIAYKGTAPALQDLIAGQTSFQFEPVPTIKQNVEAKTVIGIAVTNGTRLQTLPNVPTMAEGGLPDFEAYTWFGMFAPAKVPQPIMDKLTASLATVMADPALRAKMEGMGADPAKDSSPAYLGKYLQSEMARWIPIVKESGAQLE